MRVLQIRRGVRALCGDSRTSRRTSKRTPRPAVPGLGGEGAEGIVKLEDVGGREASSGSREAQRERGGERNTANGGRDKSSGGIRPVRLNRLLKRCLVNNQLLNYLNPPPLDKRNLQRGRRQGSARAEEEKVGGKNWTVRGEPTPLPL
uniref:Uncharacterized protein n=1 Tax=Sphaerodactylus townsendi TaxID=933632 RepID=A0ACB8FSH4_9SAUR